MRMIYEDRLSQLEAPVVIPENEVVSVTVFLLTISQ